MIITKEEFIELGFSCSQENEELLIGCIKRAEYVLNALCGGTVRRAMAQSSESAALIKQAAAFEADALMRSETGGGEIKSASVGDVSYTVTTGEGAPDAERTVIKLLRAAGCFRGAAAEVIE